MSLLPSRPITTTAPHHAAHDDGQGAGRFGRRRMLTALVAALLLGAIAAGFLSGVGPGLRSASRPPGRRSSAVT